VNSCGACTDLANGKLSHLRWSALIIGLSGSKNPERLRLARDIVIPRDAGDRSALSGGARPHRGEHNLLSVADSPDRAGRQRIFSFVVLPGAREMLLSKSPYETSDGSGIVQRILRQRLRSGSSHWRCGERPGSACRRLAGASSRSHG